MNVTICKFCDFACMLEGGKGSIIGMFDTIGLPQFPMQYSAFHVCVELEFSPDEAGRTFDVEVSLVDALDNRLFAVNMHIPVMLHPDGRKVRIFQNFAIEGLVFPHEGTYRLVIAHEGTKATEENLYVLFQPPPKS